LLPLVLVLERVPKVACFIPESGTVLLLAAGSARAAERQQLAPIVRDALREVN
jgi:hypothetical protein